MKKAKCGNWKVKKERYLDGGSDDDVVVDKIR